VLPSESEPAGPDIAAAPDHSVAAEAAPATEERQAPPADPRDAIVSRARERRAAEISEAGKDPQVAVLDQYAGAEPAAVTDATTDVVSKAAAANVAAAAEDRSPSAEGIKISVYGEDVIVSEDDVRTAGIATLQKERAAEYRLQEASKSEGKLRQYHRELDAYRDSLKTMEKDIRAGKPPGTNDAATVAAPPAPAGASVTVDDAKLAEGARKAAEAIYRGDPKETAEALKALLADVAQGRTATPPPVDVNAVAEAAADVVDQRTEKRTDEQKRAAVNRTFATEFTSVAKNPEAFAVAQTRFNALLSDPDNSGKPWEDLAREAGKAAIQRYPELSAGEVSNVAANGGKPSAAGKTVVTTLQERRDLKSKTVVRQPTTGVRAAPPPPPQVRSNKQYVADLRSSRGLPPTG